jgi:hypothetical protein
VQERLDVGPAEGGGIFSPVLSPRAQGRRQADRRAGDLVQPGACLLAPPPRQVVGGPCLHGLAQPLLADAGEGEPAVMAQDGEVPPVLGDLGPRVGERPAGVHHQRVEQRLPSLLLLGGQVLQRGHLRLAELPGQDAQRPAVAGAPGADPLLKPVEHLRHGQRGEPAQVDLAGHRDRLGPLVPPSPVQPRVSEKGGLPPARVQGAAGFLPAAAGPPFPQAGGHRAFPGPGRWKGRLPPAGLVILPPAAAVPPDQPVLGFRGQQPSRRIPPGLRQEPRVQQGGQPRRPRPRGSAVAQHRRLGSPCRLLRGGRQRGGGAHRRSPASSRGLGTASTAARSRAGSGCV